VWLYIVKNILTKYTVLETLVSLAAILMLVTLASTQEAKQTHESLPYAVHLKGKLGMPFLDHAVLQQKIPLPVWGVTLPNAEVTVAFSGQKKVTTADNEGSA
jgi:hypothetical protein